MNVDYTKKSDLKALAEQVNKLTYTAKIQILSRCAVKRLMSPPFLFRCVTFFLSVERTILMYIILFTRQPELINVSWDELVNHMVNGKDLSDKKSAGGWNADELAIFLDLVKRYK